MLWLAMLDRKMSKNRKLADFDAYGDFKIAVFGHSENRVFRQVLEAMKIVAQIATRLPSPQRAQSRLSPEFHFTLPRCFKTRPIQSEM